MKKEKERLEALKLAQFNRDIRKDDGKLDLVQLRKLNSVYKNNYIKMVEEDIYSTQEKLDHTEKKVLDRSTDVVELIWGIEDTKLTWDNSIDQINQALERKAIEIGITKGDLENQF